jgi:hypothetical protein
MNYSWLINVLESGFGHHLSVEQKKPVDVSGRPLPWYTYPAIEYLNQLDFTNLQVFEYGSGNGSFYWSAKAKTITSVENNSVWYQQIIKQKKPNQEILLRTLPKDYVNSISLRKKKYDVIIIDGVFREQCAQKAIDWLKATGFIILDNSDWYRKAGQVLRQSGLIQIDFSGLGPVNTYSWTTSLFLSRQVRLKPINNYQPSNPVGGQLVDEQAEKIY